MRWKGHSTADTRLFKLCTYPDMSQVMANDLTMPRAGGCIPNTMFIHTKMTTKNIFIPCECIWAYAFACDTSINAKYAHTGSSACVLSSYVLHCSLAHFAAIGIIGTSFQMSWMENHSDNRPRCSSARKRQHQCAQCTCLREWENEGEAILNIAIAGNFSELFIVRLMIARLVQILH